MQTTESGIHVRYDAETLDATTVEDAVEWCRIRREALFPDKTIIRRLRMNGEHAVLVAERVLKDGYFNELEIDEYAYSIRKEGIIYISPYAPVGHFNIRFLKKDEETEEEETVALSTFEDTKYAEEFIMSQLKILGIELTDRGRILFSIGGALESIERFCDGADSSLRREVLAVVRERLHIDGKKVVL